jgi:hypothetical protein
MRSGSITARGEARGGDASANRSNGGRIERGSTQREGGHEARISEGNREGRQPSTTREAAPDNRSGRDGGRTYDREPARSNDRGDGRTYENNNRSNDRGRNDGNWNNNRSNDRNRGGDRHNNGNWRNDNRNRGGSYGNNHYGNRTPYYHNGRVSRVSRWNNGYRVWIGGSPFPFFIPMAHWRNDLFRVGVSIRLGGYYNPLGYYDYYDPYYDDNYAYSNRAYSRGDLRGTVESVDWRRDTFVIRNEATGSFVTVVARNRREDDNIRPGDYVEISGDWTRSGIFEARDVDLVRDERYER